MPYFSDRAAYRKGFEGEMVKRTKAASIYLSAQVKADVSQPGTLRYNPTLKSGRASKATKTVYHFTHSRPFNPPYKQSGNLRMSIAWEPADGGLVGRVGSNIKRPRYPLYLELGTRRMKHRSFLRAGLRKNAAALRQILTRSIPAGGLAPVRSFQFRPGHFGRGAAAAGWS